MATLGGMPLQEPVEVRLVVEVAAQSQGPVGLAAWVVVAEPVQARPAPVDAAERAARRMVAALEAPTRGAAQVDRLAPVATPGVRTPLRRPRRELQPAARPATLTPVLSAAEVRGAHPRRPEAVPAQPAGPPE
jgi:hypothetical protein